MINSIDHLGNHLSLNDFPRKIVSLVPSQSELLWDLNLRDELVGITKFCIHPDEMFHSITRVGGTKKVDRELIRKLNPDLIIGNKEENTKEDIENLQKDFPVWMSDVNTYSEALSMIKEIGRITNREKESGELLGKLENIKTEETNLRVIYLIWNEPMMCAGTFTFIHDMILKAGFINCIEEKRYPQINIEEIKALKPDFLFLSTEPFPFSDSHVENFLKSLPDLKVRLVDGEMFSWYGSRLIQSFAYFDKLRNELNQR